MDTAHTSLASLVAPQHTAVLVVDVQPLFTAMPLVPALDEVLPRGPAPAHERPTVTRTATHESGGTTGTHDRRARQHLQ